MRGFPIERPEPGENTGDEDYQQEYEQRSRPPMSERQLNAMIAQTERGETSEGVELDIAMETLREAQGDRVWASKQCKKLARNFKAMKG
jgi:hypothetical protein